MDTKLITEVTHWMKTTDLAEFCYEKNGDGIEIITQDALPEPTEFTCSLTPVSSPAIGIYHAAAKGKNLVLKEGQKVEEGAALGVVETASKQYPVTAPLSGTLRVVTAEEGAAVEFGLPLFFIEKK